MNQLPVKLRGDIKGKKQFNKEDIGKVGEGIKFSDLMKMITGQTKGQITEQLNSQDKVMTKEITDEILNVLSSSEKKEVIQIDTDEIKEELVNLDGLINNRVFMDIKVKDVETNKTTSEEDVLKTNKKSSEIVRIAKETLKEIENKQQVNKEVKPEINKVIKEKIEVIQNGTKLKVDTKENVVIENKTINKNDNNKIEVKTEEIEVDIDTKIDKKVKVVGTKDTEIELKDLVTSKNKIIKISDESSEIKSSVVNQVKEKIEFIVDKTDRGFEGVKEVKMKLNPESLGEVDIKIEFKEGKINVEIITQTEETKKLIESSSSELTKILGKTDEKNVTITVNSYNKTAEINDERNSESHQGSQGQKHQNEQNKNEQNKEDEFMENEFFFEMLRMKNKILLKI